VYIRKKAVLPLTGSGGGGGAFSTAFWGASEQAENIMAATVVKKRRDFIIEIVDKQIPVYRARIRATREVRS
jgi:hypothetical protein